MEGAEEGPHPASDTKVAATTNEILLIGSWPIQVASPPPATTATHHPSLYLFLTIEHMRTYRAYIPLAI